MSDVNEAVGVDYAKIDPAKLDGQAVAKTTAYHLSRFGYRDVAESRGESCYLIDCPDMYKALVIEGLGTKNLAADTFRVQLEVAEQISKNDDPTYYRCIGQDGVAMIVNDMITSGASPVMIGIYMGTGLEKWLEDKARLADLYAGWKRGCDLARCAWGPGEMPTLNDLIYPEALDLAGAAYGEIKPKKRRILGNIQVGDAIVLIHSTGIHANGLTKVRQLAAGLPEGFLTKMSNGEVFGEALLKPTPIYTSLIEDCLDNDIELHYLINVTGHGWRKLMRATPTFSYVIEQLPVQLPIFDFIQSQLKCDRRAMYGAFNMGAGFAIILPESQLEKLKDAIQVNNRRNDGQNLGYTIAGYVENSNSKQVVIDPEHIVFSQETMAIR